MKAIHSRSLVVSNGITPAQDQLRRMIFIFVLLGFEGGSQLKNAAFGCRTMPWQQP